MEDQSWPFRHEVLTTAGIFAAGGGFAAAVVALSQIWALGILSATALLAIAFFIIALVFRRRVSDVDRVDTDWQKVHEALHDFSAIERAIQDEIAGRDLDVSNCVQLTDKLLGAALTHIQRAFERLCPEVVCSMKILRRNAEEEFFECLYGRSLPPKFHEFVDYFKLVDRKNSYAARALDESRVIFSGNLWKKSETGDEFLYPYDEDVGEKLKECGVQGLIVAPIFLKNSVNGHFEPRAVFKIDYFVVDGLIDNHPTRRTIEFLTSRLGSLLQQCLTLCGRTIDDLTLARTEE